jgi:HAD superfamily hydrolase (TIGR01549 family)
MKSFSAREVEHLDPAAFEAILVDIGNVLFYDFPMQLAYSYFVHQEIKLRQLRHRPSVYDILSASRNPGKLIRSLGSVELWADVNSAAWGRVLRNWSSLCIPIPGALEALRRLSCMRVALVANQPRETLAVLEELGIDRLVDEIILDSTVGISKPDLGIYTYAVNRLHAQPESSLMIGDRLDNDIRPAKAIGMTAVWIRNTHLDESVAVPLVSTWWKRHYLRLRTPRNADVSLDYGTEVAADYVCGRLADVFDE